MFSIKSFILPFLYGAMYCALIANTAAAAPSDPADPLADDIMDLSLEELLDIEVTSVSKKRQKLSQTAAAVFVITQEEIRRSGVTSIPEALRMAPGVQVGRIDSNKWAISIRGNNRRFADKLLVLIDGRSVYTPTFSGVQWAVQDTLLDDVDRIEVIRGPGASLWGANAVNGVINIITKSAENTQGGLVNAGIGTEERGFGSVRYGGSLGEDLNYRVYAKYFDRDGGKSLNTGDDTADDWQVSRAGFRTDWQNGADDSITMQGDIYTGDIGETSREFSFSPPSLTLANREQDMSGGNILWRWNHNFSDESNFTLQTYYDRTSGEWDLAGKETRDTVDIDFQHRFQLDSRNDLVWGLNYRYTADNFTNSDTLSFDPDSRDYQLFSAFIHDEISLIPDRVSLILGSKFEHNDFTGFEYQPNARLLWTPTEKQTAWLSVSRAVRVPSRHDHDGLINGLPGVLGFPRPLAPGVVSVNGTRDLDAERLIAYELGYRNQISHQFSVDVTGFYNDYGNLRGAEARAPICQPFGVPVAQPTQCLTLSGATHTLFPLVYTNELTAEAYGAEIALDWRVTDYWQLQGAYSYLQLQYHANGGSLTSESREGESPHHQASLRSAFDIRENLELDLWLRYTEDLPALEVRNFLTLDARLAWRPFEQVELSIVGQNLLDSRHQEFTSEIGDLPPVEIERSGYFQMKVDF